MDRCKTPENESSTEVSARALRRERHLPPVRASHGAARDFVRDVLELWGRDDIVDDALVVIGELLTNALIHAPSPEYVVVVEWNGGLIRLEVWDSSPSMPQKLPIDLDGLHGRGMLIVDALSGAWGTRTAASGKCVWSVLPTKPKEID